MKDQIPHRIPTSKLVAVAIALGIVAGAGAVYVKLGGSGNAPPQEASAVPAAPAAAAPGCKGAKAVAASLKSYAVGAVAAMTPEEAPRQLRRLAFKNAAGKSMTLADYAGKTLLVNVWATWCVPCRQEMPTLDRLEQKRGGSDFQVVAINIDTGDPQKPVKFLDQIGASHVALHRDPTMAVFHDLKKEGLAFGLPVTLLVGEDGCLLAAMNGPAEWDGPEALKLVDAAVGHQARESKGPNPT